MAKSLPFFLRMPFDEVQSVICNQEFTRCFREIKEEEKAPSSFHSTKCFGGRKWPTEIDAVISNDSEELCFIEYEDTFKYLCNNFMKMRRLKQPTPERPFDSLFVTRLTDKKSDSTLDRFDKYMARANHLLDTLLGEWSVLALVNLLIGNPRLKWYPSRLHDNSE